MDDLDPGMRREVTRALCWLPPHPADTATDTDRQGEWSRTQETRRVFGRVGVMVITETFRVEAAPVS